MASHKLLLPISSKAEFYPDPELDPEWYPGEGEIVREFVFPNGDTVTTLHARRDDEIITCENGLDYYDASGAEIIPPQAEPYISMLLFEAFRDGYLRYLEEIEGRLLKEGRW